MNAEKTLWGLYVETIIQKERQRGIRRFRKHLKKRFHNCLLQMTGKEQITSFWGFYFQRKPKPFQPDGQRSCPWKQLKNQRVSGKGEPCLCCVLAQPHSLLDCNMTAPYASAHSRRDNTTAGRVGREMRRSSDYLDGWLLAQLLASSSGKMPQDFGDQPFGLSVPAVHNPRHQPALLVFTMDLAF